MKKVLIYYFSGTGNTKLAVDIYKEYFNNHRMEVNVIEIKYPIMDIKLQDADYLGIFYPIHAFNAPKIVLEFIKKFPHVNDKKYFIVKTSGEPLKINNISSLYLKDILRCKGYTLTNEYHYIMPYNMIFRHTDLMAYKMYESLCILAKKDVNEIINGINHKLSYIPFGRVIAFIFRIEHIGMNINGRFFKVDKNKCINCLCCEKNCPTNNIIIKDGKFKFLNNCIMCTRCSFNCPKNAISIGILNNWKVNGRYTFKKPLYLEKDMYSWYCKKSYKKYFNKVDLISDIIDKDKYLG